MGSIQSFIEKHNGNFYQEAEKSAQTPIGKFTSQAKWGNTNFKGRKISVSIDEVGGANPVAELFRMKLVLETPMNDDLLIFPRSYWGRFFRNLYSKNIYSHYKFSGTK